MPRWFDVLDPLHIKPRLHALIAQQRIREQ